MNIIATGKKFFLKKDIIENISNSTEINQEILTTLKDVIKVQVDGGTSEKLKKELTNLSSKIKFNNLNKAKLTEEIKNGNVEKINQAIEIQNIAVIAQLNG